MKIVEPSAQPRPLLYTDLDSAVAHREWKATCGPHSIAAACAKSLDDVRAAMLRAGVNYRGWMSPTQVTNTLHSLGVFPKIQSKLKTMDLCNGINRVQWEGKWLNPGVPPRVAYFHTHLVAHFDQWVLCTCCEQAKWIPEWEWRHFHLMCEPRSPFHITHHWTLDTRAEALGAAGAQLSKPLTAERAAGPFQPSFDLGGSATEHP